MSSKLIIRNMPKQMTQEKFKDAFQNFQGFISSEVKFNNMGEVIQGELVYQSLTNARYVKNIMWGYIFPGTTQAITIDNQEDMQGMQQNQHMPQQQQQQQGYIQQKHPQQQMQVPQQQQQHVNSMQQLNPNQNYQQQQPNMQNIPQQQMQQPPMNQPQQQQQIPPFIPQNPGINNIPNNNGPAPPIYNNNNGQIPVQNMNQFSGMVQQAMNTNNGGQNNQNVFSLFKIPPDASDSLYVDNFPYDAQERELAHIFRPFPGYLRVRLIKKKTSSGRDYSYCFVDFENPLQSSIALQTLKGYRFDKNDKKGITISFANAPQESTRGGRR